MLTDAALTRSRAAAEARMTDTCTITRGIGTGQVDDNTGVITSTEQEIYTGKCRLQERAVHASDQSPGQDHQLLTRLELHLPITVTGLKGTDRVRITASAHDPELVGQVLLVRDLAAKTDATARRIGVTRRTS